MGGSNIEKEFAGKKRASVWTYLILAVLLLVLAVVANLVIKNPEGARAELEKFIGLPGWALASIALVVGAFIYWIGLKVETDWPEILGAFVIAGAVTAFEILFGWHRLELGLVVVPYIIPLFVFVVLVIVAVKRSV
jgi:hypothetical protein